ncbi:MAG: nitroreductase family protein [Syntrophus sp. (in: bacteria)]
MTKVKGSEIRKADHPIDNIFLDRWSPRAMSGEEIPEAELMSLFEAARWAPSANNNQPWRILYSRRNTEHWPLFFNLLTDSNKIWAGNSSVLLVIVSKNTFNNGKPSQTHSYDAGAAWENLALQGSFSGYVVHGMQGFDYELARSSLNIPDGFTIEAMAAIGIPGNKDDLPDYLKERESPNDRRKLTDTVCEGSWVLLGL